MARWQITLAVFIVTLAGGPLQLAQSGLPALRPEGSQVEIRRTWLIGMEFSVSRPVTVNSLGRIDVNGNGLLDDPVAPRVGLWDVATGDLLRSTSIDLTTPSVYGGFFSDVDSIVLEPGNYVVGTQTFASAEPIGMLTGRTRMFADMARVRGLIGLNDDFVLPTRFVSSQMIAPSFLIDQALLINQPTPWSVAQRNDDGLASVAVEGFLASEADAVEARAVLPNGSATEWQPLSFDATAFSGRVTASTGWNTIEVRVRQDGQLVGSDSVGQVGVGEVFVTAGQSNSANHGTPAQQPKSGMVGAMDATGYWQIANDPQPIATGNGGTPWPILGDLLAEQLDAPIGFVSVGWGGTRVDQWLPGGTLYPRLQNALERLGPHGVRAVLWHQGESDSVNSTSSADYANRLQQVIAQSRVDAGFDVPWGVALAAFLPGTSLAQEAAVLAGQQQVIDADPRVFAGPTTEDLLGPDWRYDDVHFNQKGLEEHAARWAESIRTRLIPEPNGIALWLVLGLLVRRR